MRHGGKALFNGVVFESTDVKAKAIRKKGKIITSHNIDHRKYEYTENTRFSINDFLERVPFIRGAWFALKVIASAWKMFIVLFISLMSYTFLFSQGNTEGANDININFDYFFIGIWVAVFLTFHITQIGKYHAAEHMTSNCYLSGKSLTVENVRKQSRIHRACGTNLVIFVSLVGLLLSIIPFTRSWNDFLILLLTWSIAFELFVIEDKRVKRILEPVYKVGSFAQYVFFTSKPKDEHLDVAIESFKTMEKYQKELDEMGV
ncbi:DUF1385 domain-containing protein [Niallia sp. FSL M8-0099]|uniref:DUF1385 domain-containing protein n=1 Tax=Niallia sp. FSL M8-0099 TaxID=2954519 RepID=UPI0030F8D5D0